MLGTGPAFRRFRRALSASFALVIVAALAACGGGADSTAPSEPDAEAIEQARQEGAQQARQNARIKALRDKVRDADRDAESAAAAPPSIAPPSAASSYVPTYVSYTPSDPNYSYLAEIPSGGGWSAPVESYPTGGELLRTSLRGPDGTLVIIDYTPSEVPQLGGEYDAAGVSLPTNFGTATEYIFSESEGLPDCNGRPCADFLVNDGLGGGWGVLGGGPSLPVAESIAARVAQSISYGE